MAAPGDWKIPSAVQPRPAAYSYDLDQTLTAIVALSSRVPDGAYTAEILGTERAGNGVLIGEDGLVLTIGYLITEAESVWLTAHDGRTAPGHVVGYDAATGFGLVQALGRLDLPHLPLGSADGLRVGDRLVMAGAGGRSRAVAAEVVARQEFAGYWEYLLDDAIFTAPSHPHWGGAALIGPAGELTGIGSLQLQQGGRDSRPINMAVPIDLLKPILHDLTTLGRVSGPPRPWLGLYATEMDDQVVVMGLSPRAPAETADLRAGDILMAVGQTEVSDLASFLRAVWALGPAGVAVPLTVHRDGRTLSIAVASADRSTFLVAPRLH
ncbi:serine protease, S1-C subfamily, contains C-terminal PDZ domain [Methylobacterium sp. 174MFSha1.1]|uniref:S1C family serine protease n=1 Tax=Methylobacterium sp. 174MFSha1.1 TaxID=1502749 RepID=UPI0008EEC7B9|nr:S1C family serine protease [Methylobacterium sp. 174MFSha1.1]SFU66078.1 serine protease, S1-C subfamily, contains C-terminal PDZ domain [Methylobacterium sp. 174MFSha1.1]